MGACGASKQEPNHALVAAALQKKGITDPHIVSGLLIAFDKNDDDQIDAQELEEMLLHVDRMQAAQEEDDDGVPSDCKAIYELANTGNGPCMKEGNEKLKMLLTSAGITPGSSPVLKEAFGALKKATPGTGVLYLVDARLPKLQFHLHNANPAKHGKQKYVAYRRDPDDTKGAPVKDAAGNLAMKSQEELSKHGPEGYAGPEGHAGVAYCLRNRGQYANGDLSVLAGQSTPGGTPVYVAYLWYNGEVANGEFVQSILLAKGAYKKGRFSAVRADGEEFSEEDYNITSSYGPKGDHWFSEVSGDEFSKVMNDVQVVYGVGGIPFLTILHYQPDFVDETGKIAKKPNPYGRAILDAVKEGKVTYVGMSAGSMAWGWTLGPLTTDAQQFMLSDPEDEEQHGSEDAKVDMGPKTELGKLWLFPGLGQYIGMPYDITCKPHVHFNAQTCSYGGTAKKADNIAKVVSAIAKQDKFVVLLTDYDWYKGQGDALEIAKGRLWYHVGSCDRSDPLPEEMQTKLRELGHETGSTIRRQPLGVPARGLKFEWSPLEGEVIAAGPHATNGAFRMYADSNGPLPDAPPAFDKAQAGQLGFLSCCGPPKPKRIR